MQASIRIVERHAPSRARPLPAQAAAGTRTDGPGARLRHGLRRVRFDGPEAVAARLAEIARSAAPQVGLPEAECLAYLRDHIWSNYIMIRADGWANSRPNIAWH